MKTRLALLLLLALPLAPAAVRAGGKKKEPNRNRAFALQLSKDEQVIHALNRLTFGPRPGDLERLRSVGLKKWVELQLHPERIAENPVLSVKLQPLDTLRMSPAELALNYPPPAMVIAVASGKAGYPEDPELRTRMETMVRRYRRRQEMKAPGDYTDAEQTAEEAGKALTPEQMQTFRSGTAEEKWNLFRNLGEQEQAELVDGMPQKMRAALFNIVPPEYQRKVLSAVAPGQVIARDLAESKIYRAVYSNRQLQEELTDFWFNHFNVYLDKGADRYLLTAYERDVIRPRVLGKFEDLLRATAESPAMLFYLDNWESVDANAAERLAPRRRVSSKRQRRGLNENYARELLELHTLGVDGGYTQHDIIEVARCFTGWTIAGPRRGGGFEFNEKTHDPGEKRVLGIKIPAGGGQQDGLRVIGILAHHPSTAHFISLKLAERFVADRPPASLVERMAVAFQKTGGDLREVMRTMLNSQEFWSEGAYRAKVKSPLEMVASAVRALDADVVSAVPLTEQLARLGEPLYRKQEPTGYSDAGADWMSSTALLGRLNFATSLAANRIRGVTVPEGRLAAITGDPRSIARELLLVDFSGDTAAAITTALDKKEDPSVPRPFLIAGFVIGAPEFQRR